MRVLGFDTATRATAVAVLDHEAGVAVECRDDPPPDVRPRHTPRLLELVAQAMGEAGAGYGDIELVAVGTGPGTFTGIRIGVASARAIAAARGLPIVGVATLHALAAGGAEIAEAEQRAPLAVLDARRREVFAAGWAAHEARQPTAAPQLPPRALVPAALASSIASAPTSWLAVGDGALLCRAELEDAGVAVPESDSELHRVSALQICRLALGLTPRTVDEIRPEYLREPDAELNRRAAAAAPAGSGA